MMHIREIPSVLPMSEAPMWTDKELAELYRLETRTADWPTWKGEDTTQKELYRLARLGLAAEQVGQDWFSEVLTDDLDFEAFRNHPAWRDK